MRAWVDTHVWRVSIRLGLIGKKVTADAAHSLLQALLPQDAQIIYNFHKGLLGNLPLWRPVVQANQCLLIPIWMRTIHEKCHRATILLTFTTRNNTPIGAVAAVMKGRREGPAPVCSSPRTWVDMLLLLCGYLADIVPIVLRKPELAVGARCNTNRVTG
jgi:hypothetical protein